MLACVLVVACALLCLSRLSNQVVGTDGLFVDGNAAVGCVVVACPVGVFVTLQGLNEAVAALLLAAGAVNVQAELVLLRFFARWSGGLLHCRIFLGLQIVPSSCVSCDCVRQQQ